VYVGAQLVFFFFFMIIIIMMRSGQRQNFAIKVNVRPST
jgi:hypothetical protein